MRPPQTMKAGGLIFIPTPVQSIVTPGGPGTQQSLEPPTSPAQCNDTGLRKACTLSPKVRLSGKKFPCLDFLPWELSGFLDAGLRGKRGNRKPPGGGWCLNHPGQYAMGPRLVDTRKRRALTWPVHPVPIISHSALPTQRRDLGCIFLHNETEA